MAKEEIASLDQAVKPWVKFSAKFSENGVYAEIVKNGLEWTRYSGKWEKTEYSDEPVGVCIMRNGLPSEVFKKKVREEVDGHNFYAGINAGAEKA